MMFSEIFRRFKEISGMKWVKNKQNPRNIWISYLYKWEECNDWISLHLLFYKKQICPNTFTLFSNVLKNIMRSNIILIYYKVELKILEIALLPAKLLKRVQADSKHFLPPVKVLKLSLIYDTFLVLISI